MAIGFIFAYAGSTAPSGYLMCDGSAISRTTYARLFSVIGTTYGSGDGSTTFNLPDCREVALVGIGENTSYSIEKHDTYTLGEFKDDQLQTHTHTYTRNNTLRGYADSANNWNGSKTANSGAPTGRKGDVTRGKRLGVNYIIKY